MYPEREGSIREELSTQDGEQMRKMEAFGLWLRQKMFLYCDFFFMYKRRVLEGRRNRDEFLFCVVLCLANLVGECSLTESHTDQKVCVTVQVNSLHGIV